MKEYYKYWKMAAAIVEQIKQLSAMVEGNDDLREYINIHSDRCFTEEDEPLVITADFIYELLFRPLIEGQ